MLSSTFILGGKKSGARGGFSLLGALSATVLRLLVLIPIVVASFARASEVGSLQLDELAGEQGLWPARWALMHSPFIFVLALCYLVALLQGAPVEIPSLNRQTLTNNLGEFVLRGVPAGTHEVVVTYTGLDASRRTVTVGVGQRAFLDVDLTSGIYQLGEFVVTGEREGNAASITRQRSAPNVRIFVDWFLG
jgi:hypothetical protein